MNAQIKKLSKETLIYGLSTVAARLLNFFLTPLYTYTLSTADAGVIFTLFALIAMMNALYIFGLDSAYMRFAANAENKREVFQHSFYAIGFWGLILSAVIIVFARGGAELIGIGADNAYLVRLAAAVLLLDALNMIPFTKLRLERRAWFFATVRTVSIVVNVTLNIVFLVCMKMGLAAVMWANIFASLTSLLLLSGVVFGEIRPQILLKFNKDLAKKMLSFAWPFVPSSMASMIVNVVDKPLLARLIGLSAVGVYQANVKTGIFMMLLVTTFDTAWRPFFIGHSAQADAKELFSKVFTLFFAGALAAALGMSFFMGDVIRFSVGGWHLIHPDYWGGTHIIPFVVFGYFFYGLYINFMVAPVITKKTKILLVSTLCGAAVSVLTNVILAPRIGITSAGLGLLLSYIMMAVVMYVFMMRNYRVAYNYKTLSFISAAGLAAGGAALYFQPEFWVKVLLFAAFAAASGISLLKQRR